MVPRENIVILVLSKGVKYLDWFASSLLPSEENKALEDRFNLYYNYQFRWLMSDGKTPGFLGKITPYNNGDVTKVENLQDMTRKMYKAGMPDLYTSDLGFEVKNYLRQEEEHFTAQVGQSLCALLTLKTGGNMVVKQFTFFTEKTRNLISLLHKVFEKLYICKPQTSKPDNSENYIIGINLLRINPQFDSVTSILFDELKTPGSILKLNNKELYDSLNIIEKQLFIAQSNKLDTNIIYFRTRKDTRQLELENRNIANKWKKEIKFTLQGSRWPVININKTSVKLKNNNPGDIVREKTKYIDIILEKDIIFELEKHKGTEISLEYDYQTLLVEKFLIKCGHLLRKIILIYLSIDIEESLGEKFPDWIISESNRLGCIDYSLFRISPETIYSCLMPYQISQVSKIFLEAIQSPKNIVDATAHIGCDTINLARIYPKSEIIAIEKNNENYNLLVKNVNTFVKNKTKISLGCKIPILANIKTLHGDSIEILTQSSEVYDLIYLDPPWGGPEYYKQNKLKLIMSGKDIQDIIKDLKAKVIVLKAPVNFDIERFLIDYPNTVVFPIKKPKKTARGDVAFNLIVVKST